MDRSLTISCAQRTSQLIAAWSLCYTDKYFFTKRPIMFGYSWGPILIILVIVLLLFGPKRLPELGESIGKAINSFKKAHDEPAENLTYKQEAEPGKQEAEPESTASETKKNACPQCQKELGGDFAFCPHCGHNLKSA